MKLKNHLLFLLLFVITCTLIVCTSQHVQVKKEIDCSILLEESKDALIKGKEYFLMSKKHQFDDAVFEFPESYQCITENKVIFEMFMSIRYFDINVNTFLCTTVSMEAIAERKAGEIKFEFGDLVIRSLEICNNLKKGVLLNENENNQSNH